MDTVLYIHQSQQTLYYIVLYFYIILYDSLSTMGNTSSQ